MATENRGWYASLADDKDLRPAQGIDHVVATAPRTAEIFGVTQSGKSYVRVDDDKGNTLAYATFAMNDRWRDFLNRHFREFAGHSNIPLDEDDEDLGAPKVADPDPPVWFAAEYAPKAETSQ